MSGLFSIFDHRARALQVEASYRNLHSALKDPFDCKRAPFPLLRRGVDQRVKTVLWRDDDPHAVRVFDYRYFTDIKSDTVPSPLFTCATALVNAAWPYLSIRPASGKLGFATRFEEHDEIDVLDMAFAEAFNVRSSDDRFATALLDVEMRQFLLKYARALDIEFNGAWLFISAEQIPVGLAPNLFGFIDDLIDSVPPVVNSLFEPPLKGDIHTPMPDPGVLAAAGKTGADHALEAFDVNEATDTEQVVSAVLGHNNRLPFFGSTELGGARARAVFTQDIIDTQPWTEVSGPILELTSEEEFEEYDLDGNPIHPYRQDPWGPGRILPEEPDKAD